MTPKNCFLTRSIIPGTSRRHINPGVISSDEKARHSVLICMIARKRDKLSAPSWPAQFVSTNFPQNLWQSRSVQGEVFYPFVLYPSLFLFFLLLSPSLCPFFVQRMMFVGKKGPVMTGVGKETRALLINYSVGVALLKIKIGSLSGATWNFFLNRLRGRRGREATTATGFLPSWRKEGPRRRRSFGRNGGIRLARLFGSAKRLLRP